MLTPVTMSDNANGARGSTCAAGKIVPGHPHFEGGFVSLELLSLPTDVIVMKNC